VEVLNRIVLDSSLALWTPAMITAAAFGGRAVEGSVVPSGVSACMDLRGDG
jgi:hypothetical protein